MRYTIHAQGFSKFFPDAHYVSGPGIVGGFPFGDREIATAVAGLLERAFEAGEESVSNALRDIVNLGQRR